MINVYKKYMHKITMTITTRLQDRREGLITLPNESVANPIPRQSQSFPEESGITRQMGHLFHPQPGSVECFHRQTEIKYPPAETGSSIPMSPTSRLRFISPVVSPGRMLQTPSAFITSFHTTYLHPTRHVIFRYHPENRSIRNELLFYSKSRLRVYL